MLLLVKIFLFKKYQNVLRVCRFYAKISLILDIAARNSTTKQTLLSNYAFMQSDIDVNICRIDVKYMIIDHYKNLYHKCQNTLYNYTLSYNIRKN